MLVNTVEDNKEGFTAREIRDAEAERVAYEMVGRPSEADFKSMVRLNLLKNLPVTSKAIRNAYKIFGPDVPALKRHTVRRAAPRAEFFNKLRRTIDLKSSSEGRPTIS